MNEETHQLKTSLEQEIDTPTRTEFFFHSLTTLLPILVLSTPLLPPLLPTTSSSSHQSRTFPQHLPHRKSDNNNFLMFFIRVPLNFATSAPETIIKPFKSTSNRHCHHLHPHPPWIEDIKHRDTDDDSSISAFSACLLAFVYSVIRFPHSQDQEQRGVEISGGWQGHITRGSPLN